MEFLWSGVVPQSVHDTHSVHAWFLICPMVGSNSVNWVWRLSEATLHRSLISGLFLCRSVGFDHFLIILHRLHWDYMRYCAIKALNPLQYLHLKLAFPPSHLQAIENFQSWVPSNSCSVTTKNFPNQPSLPVSSRERALRKGNSSEEPWS